MKIADKNLGDDLLIVAEVGNNHEGSYSLAEELVGLAAEAGADAVKFQTFRTDHFVTPINEARYEKLESFRLSYQDFERLSRVATDAGIMFISTPFDLESAQFLNEICSVIKIASGDNQFYPLLKTVAEFHKPLLLSTGMLNLQQVGYSKAYIEDIWARDRVNPGCALLHCVSSYPVPPEQANVGAVRTMLNEFGGVVGYSDHTIGNDAALAAIAMGARVIEKHFTIRNDYSSFRDHQLSADPIALKDLVCRARGLVELIGDGVKEPQPCERENIEGMRRSIAAATNLDAGQVLGLGDLTWVRPGTGVPPGSESTVLGRTLKRNVSKGHLLTLDCLESTPD